MADAYCAMLRFVPDWATKLSILDAAFSGGCRSLARGSKVIRNSPLWTCRTVFDLAENTGLMRSTKPLHPKQTVHQLAYEHFFNHVHPSGAAQERIDVCFRNRWRHLYLFNVYDIPKTTARTCKNLRWLAKRVPPRVHIANVRFVCNGWHTARRYQNRVGSQCLFCCVQGCEDSIEHIVHCKTVRSLFPTSLLRGSPPELPVGAFFMLGLEGKERMAMALVIFALYTLHNELRHSSTSIRPQDFRKCIYRIVAEVDMHHAFKAAWYEVLQWESAGFSSAKRVKTSDAQERT